MSPNPRADAGATPPHIIRADARRIPLADGSVHCAVTSPPYFGLRDYGVDGQIGLEQTPEAYVSEMVAVFREVRRVLRDDGTLWLNIGDSYNAYNGNRGKAAGANKNHHEVMPDLPSGHGLTVKGMKAKDLIGIPWMLAFALRADGWYLRQDIIWSKPNPMPESVTDRCTKAHEYLFLLTKSARYYYDAEAIKEKAGQPQGEARITGQRKIRLETMQRHGSGAHSTLGSNQGEPARNRRSVWTISTQACPEAHFATYPVKLVTPCILAGTSAHGVCASCGSPWRRVVEKLSAPPEVFHNRSAPQDELCYAGSRVGGVMKAQGQKLQDWRNANPPRTTHWLPTCKCGTTATVPATVFDPFNGAGTTGIAAKFTGRRYVGTELNAAYIDIAVRRIANAVPKRDKAKRAKRVPFNQPSLFAEAR